MYDNMSYTIIVQRDKTIKTFKKREVQKNEKYNSRNDKSNGK